MTLPMTRVAIDCAVAPIVVPVDVPVPVPVPVPAPVPVPVPVVVSVPEPVPVDVPVPVVVSSVVVRSVTVLQPSMADCASASASACIPLCCTSDVHALIVCARRLSFMLAHALRNALLPNAVAALQIVMASVVMGPVLPLGSE